jgi:hypothetical protein
MEKKGNPFAKANAKDKELQLAKMADKKLPKGKSPKAK